MFQKKKLRWRWLASQEDQNSQLDMQGSPEESDSGDVPLTMPTLMSGFSGAAASQQMPQHVQPLEMSRDSTLTEKVTDRTQDATVCDQNQAILGGVNAQATNHKVAFGNWISTMMPQIHDDYFSEYAMHVAQYSLEFVEKSKKLVRGLAQQHQQQQQQYQPQQHHQSPQQYQQQQPDSKQMLPPPMLPIVVAPVQSQVQYLQGGQHQQHGQQ